MCTWGWGGVGWGNTVHVNLNRHGLYDVHLGLGWGGVGQHRSCQLEQAWTVWCGMTCVFVQVDLNVMLPSPIFSCTCTHTRHATLCDLPLHLHMHEMLRSAIFSCACTHTHTSCYALGSSLPLAHERHATLCYLLLHLDAHVMLRSGNFSCTCAHTWQTVCRLWVTSYFPSRDLDIPVSGPFRQTNETAMMNSVRTSCQKRILLRTYWRKTATHRNGMDWQKTAGTWSWSDSISYSTAWSFVGDSHAATLSPPAASDGLKL